MKYFPEVRVICITVKLKRMYARRAVYSERFELLVIVYPSRSLVREQRENRKEEDGGTTDTTGMRIRALAERVGECASAEARTHSLLRAMIACRLQTIR